MIIEKQAGALWQREGHLDGAIDLGIIGTAIVQVVKNDDKTGPEDPDYLVEFIELR